MSRRAWQLACIAAALMALATGGRQASGLFVSPLNSASGLGLATISLALALGQLGVGIAQPILGHWADRLGSVKVIVVGAITLTLTTALPAFWLGAAPLFIALVASAVANSAVGSNGLLLGPVTRAVPAREAGVAIGFIGAGASAGQLVLGPLLQWLIEHFGWQTALLALAALSLTALPLARGFREPPRDGAAAVRHPVGDVLRQWTFWRYALSFGMCGLHVAFLAAHMPGAIERCGLPASLAGPWIALAGAANIAGSLAVGFAMKRLDAAALLASIYVARALAIATFVLLPITPSSLMLFGLLMGATHMATLPPTSALVARHYGTARLGTLFGVVMLVHQVGSFVGIWLGGWLAQTTRTDHAFWTTDVLMALVAAALVLPKARLSPALPPPAASAMRS